MPRFKDIPLVLGVLLLACCDVPADDGPVVVLQDFEGRTSFDTWPDGAKAELSGEWAADGKQSLKIARGTMASIDDLRTHDWSAYQVWRFHVRVPGGEGVSLGLELTDSADGYLNRHQNTASAPPGDSVVEIDIGGALWRGEMNKPYRQLQTPLDKKNIKRFAITPRNGDIHIDQVELAKVQRIAADGGFAFDFGRAGGLVQSQWIGVTPETKWDEQRGYGITPGATAARQDTPYPTPVLGDGIVMNEARFAVRLKPGKHAGWMLLERSGFWEGEQACYRRAELLVNGKAAHGHEARPDDPYFLFEDLEVLTQEDLVHKLVMARQQAADFGFDAVEGKNEFALAARGVAGRPPRLAGLVIAPDTADGRGFIEAHKKLQYETIARVHRLMQRRNRAGDPDKARTPLVVAPLPTDAVIYPGDWPAATESQPVPVMHAMAGVTVGRLLGVYAAREMKIDMEMTGLKGPGGSLPPECVRILGNRYLPVRDYDQTACWIESHHYRPVGNFHVAPTVARGVLVVMDIPANTKAGTYAGSISLIGRDPNRGQIIHRENVPLSVRVHPGALPALEMPSGLFFSGVPAPKDLIGDRLYWQLTDQLLRQMQRGSLNMLTGGPNYAVSWENSQFVYYGDDGVRLLRMAGQYGLDRKVSGYGGFKMELGREKLRPQAGMTVEQTYAAMHRGWETFRGKHNLPEHYVNSFDEPGTAEEFEPLREVLQLMRGAGFKTMGYTSMEDPRKADANHRMLARETTAPAFNLHSPQTMGYVRDLGNEPWIYNNGLGRSASGVDLWRAHRYGAAGRLQWIGAIVQGFQYDSLDAREPDPSCFFVHRDLGVLMAPRYLGQIEGGFDARLLFELERRARTAGPARDKILALFKEIEDRPYRQERAWDELEALRVRMLEMIEASNP
jgi:hypothetical protein